MKALEFSVDESPDRAVIALKGELDYAGSGDVEAELARLEAGGSELIVLDLRGLTFIDSSGLRLILSAHARARDTGGTFKLIPGPDVVHRVFEIALLDRRLEFIDAELIDAQAI